MNLDANKNETLKEYKIRLFRNKKKYNLTDKDIARLINKNFNKNYDESSYRKWFKPYQEGYEDAIKDFENENIVLKTFEEKRIKFEKEKIKFMEQRNAYNQKIREEARNDVNMQLLKEAILNLKPYAYIKKDIILSDNDLLIGLNDIHFGATVNNYWNKYDSNIAKNRLEKYLNKILQIKNIHKSEKCYVCANGDLISGNIHSTIKITNRENVIEQITGVSELISWFLSELCNIFTEVHFSVVAGNHSRLSTKEDSPIYERLDDLIPWYVKARLSNFNNLIIENNNIDRTLNLINIRGKNYVNIHGDYDNFKNPQGIISMIKEPIYCLHFGHLHHNKTDYFKGYKIIMSGSLMGIDDYCVSKRITGVAQQLVCVCTKDGIEANYDVILQNEGDNVAYEN